MAHPARHSPIWLRTIRHVVARRARPSARRLAIWRARNAFVQIATALEPGDIAIDAGANVGEFTAPMAASGATVHAFEPDPYAYAELRKRFATAANVHVHRAAVGAVSGTITLYRAAGVDADPVRLSKSSSVIATKANVDPSAGTEVPVVDLGAFIEGHHPVRLLKMDIEGAEAETLERLLELDLLAGIEAVFVEAHDHKIEVIAPRMTAVRARIAEAGLVNVNLDWA